MLYRERVFATRWFTWLIRLVILVSVGSTLVGAFVDEEAGVGTRVALSVTMIAVLLMMFLVDRWFMRLNVEVSRTAVTASFGPFKKRLTSAEIRQVHVEPYQWRQYGGWGLRRGFGNRRAWTVPFLNTGVVLTVRDGARYYISSRSPEQLLRGVEDMIGRSGRSSGQA